MRSHFCYKELLYTSHHRRRIPPIITYIAYIIGVKLLKLRTTAVVYPSLYSEVRQKMEKETHYSSQSRYKAPLPMFDDCEDACACDANPKYELMEFHNDGLICDMQQGGRSEDLRKQKGPVRIISLLVLAFAATEMGLGMLSFVP
jgi:hypothetical protein